jgi:2-dehydropantoate 2-reductase
VSIVIIGGGAIGLLLAGRLAQSAQHVALLARPATVQALHDGQIILERRATVRQLAVPPLASEPADLPAAYQQPDLAILCVKSYDTAAALPQLHALKPWQILTLQNGLGNEERLVQEFGAEHIISGAITSSVWQEAPGAIRLTKEGGIGIADIGETPRLRIWGAVLAKAGFRVREYADYRALKWSKALLNMLANATPAILDMPVTAVYTNPHLIALERAAFLEALAVMQQLGLRPQNLPSYPTRLLALAMRYMPEPALSGLLRRLVAGGRGGKLPSLHADLRRGRAASEGAFLYGEIACRASAAGVAAPVNTALWQTLHAIASGAQPWDAFRGQPERLIAAVQQRRAALAREHTP